MAKTKQPDSKQDREWAEAKRRCRLSLEDIRMAKELGLNPRSLIKNTHSPNQRWKVNLRALQLVQGTTNAVDVHLF